MFRKSVIRKVSLALFCVASVNLNARNIEEAPVSDAAMKGDIETVRTLITEGANVNAKQGDGMTALHWATFQDDIEMTKLLIEARANVSLGTRVGHIKPMNFAAQNGNALMIELLLNAGANVHAITSIGITALMEAAMSGSMDAVNLLINHGAFVNEREAKNGQTALMLAAWQNRPAVIRLLVRRGAHVGLGTFVISMKETVRHNGVFSAQNQQRNLRVPGANSTMGGQTALLFAAREGHIESVRTLIEVGADVDQINAGEGTNPLVIAIANGHYTVAKTLLDAGADPNIANIDGLTALYATVNMRHAPISWAPNPPTDQEEVDSLALIQQLLEKGANPNARIKRKLWFSPSSHDRGWVDYAGATPFWRAAQSSDIDAMRILKNFGALPNVTTYGGTTPLMAAAGIGWIGNFSQNLPGSWMDAVKYCLELGNNINSVDENGYTALHGAASRGDNEMVQYLVKHGADVTALTNNGDSAADMAFGPSRFFIPRPDTRDLLVRLGSPFKDNCRSDQCVDGKFNAEIKGPNNQN